MFREFTARALRDLPATRPLTLVNLPTLYKGHKAAVFCSATVQTLKAAMAKREVLCLFDVDGTLTPSRLVSYCSPHAQSMRRESPP